MSGHPKAFFNEDAGKNINTQLAQAVLYGGKMCRKQEERPLARSDLQYNMNRTWSSYIFEQSFPLVKSQLVCFALAISLWQPASLEKTNEQQSKTSRFAMLVYRKMKGNTFRTIGLQYYCPLVLHILQTTKEHNLPGNPPREFLFYPTSLQSMHSTPPLSFCLWHLHLYWSLNNVDSFFTKSISVSDLAFFLADNNGFKAV